MLIYIAKVLVSVIDLRSVADFTLGRPRRDHQIIKFTSSVYMSFETNSYIILMVNKVWIILNFKHLVDKENHLTVRPRIGNRLHKRTNYRSQCSVRKDFNLFTEIFCGL